MSLVSTIALEIHSPLMGGDGGLRGLHQTAEVQVQGEVPQSMTKPNDNGTGIEVERPSISFHPSLQRHQSRVNRLAKLRGGLPMPNLPLGFPSSIEGPRLWSVEDSQDMSSFVETLTSNDVGELETALANYKHLPGERGPEGLTKELFSLPNLTHKLDMVSRDLHQGHGLVIIRGLKPSKYSALDNALLFAGLASHVGEQRGAQDDSGNMLTHLTDMSFKFGKNSKRSPAFNSRALPYHTDVCDILCLYSLGVAMNGGETLFAPSAAVYNEIAATRPDVIGTLADPTWIYNNEIAPEDWHATARPLLFPESTHGPFFCFSRKMLTGTEHAPLAAPLPPMTETQAEALDMVHFVAQKHSVRVRLQPGDVLLCNNFAVLHGREAFRDAEPQYVTDGGARRHIMRLWARHEERAWETPAPLAREWQEVYGENGRKAHAKWNIVPEGADVKDVIGHTGSCS